jgi:hypothetical protein
MTTAAPSTALATIQPVFTDAERLALAGFLAGYRGLTREAYALDPGPGLPALWRKPSMPARRTANRFRERAAPGGELAQVERLVRQPHLAP